MKYNKNETIKILLDEYTTGFADLVSLPLMIGMLLFVLAFIPVNVVKWLQLHYRYDAKTFDLQPEEDNTPSV